MMVARPDTRADQLSGPGHVAVLTSVHVPEDTRIYHRECQALASAGYRVTLVAQDSLCGPDHGIESIGVGRAPNRFVRATATAFRVMRAGLKTGATIFHLHDPELLPVGLVLRLLGNQVIYDVHEDTPQRIRHKEYLPSLLRKPMAWAVAALEHAAAATFDGVIAATPEIARRFPRPRCVTVQNFPELSEFVDIGTDDYSRRPPAIVYVGDLTQERGVIDAVRAITMSRTPGVHLHLVGPISCPRVRATLNSEPSPKIVVHGRQSRDGVRRILAQSRIGLVTLHPLPGYDTSWPIKFFEYMAAGLPVIASDFPSWRQRFGEIGSARFVDPQSPGEIAETIDDLLENPEAARKMGENGRIATMQRFSWEQEREKLLSLYAQIREAR